MIVANLNRIGNRRLIKFATTVVFLSFVPVLSGVIHDCKYFGTDGKDTGILLKEISLNHNDSSQVVIIADPVYSYEAAVSLRYYINITNKINPYGYWVNIHGTDSLISSGYEAGLNGYFGNRIMNQSLHEPEMLIFLEKKLAENFFTNHYVKNEDYQSVSALNDTRFSLYKHILIK